jgi:hypothetical protein
MKVVSVFMDSRSGRWKTWRVALPNRYRKIRPSPIFTGVLYATKRHNRWPLQVDV